MSAVTCDASKTDLHTSGTLGPRHAALLLAGMIGLALLVLGERALCYPMLAMDDITILGESWTWPATKENLWLAHNEHAMPMGRLLTFAMARLVPVTSLALAGIIVCCIAQVLAVLLLYRLVRRECGQPFYGFVAATLFGVTSIYCTCTYWFACGMWMLGLVTVLLALLMGQAWRLSGKGLYLDLCVLACCVAPGWYAGAILAGPFCCLYLLPFWQPKNALTPSIIDIAGRNSGKRLWRFESFARFAFTPLWGTLLFLAFSLPRTGEAIMHTAHYAGKTALEAFNPVEGLVNTGRSIVDNLLIGQFGIFIGDVSYPSDHEMLEIHGCLAPRLTFTILAAVGVVVLWWLWRAPQPRLVILGLAFILCSSWMILSARAGWGYLFSTSPESNRYNLLPQLGLALMVCGGLPGCGSQWLRLRRDGRLTGRQFAALCALIVICLGVNLPRAIHYGWPYEPQQKEALLAVERMQARCVEYHISGAAARKELPHLDMPAYRPFNGWDMLHGSDEPRQMEPAEVRRLLGITDP